jgi:hypothetical protein
MNSLLFTGASEMLFSIKYRIVDFSSIKYPVNLTFAAFGYKLRANKVVNQLLENTG